MGFINIQNTNFENGVTNRNANNLFGSMPQLDPTRLHDYWEDFNYYVAANYTISGAGAGTVALGDLDGGTLRLTTAGADNDAEFVSPQDMLAELRDDNKQLAASLGETHGLCDEHGDVATASLLEVWIDEAERRTWFLFEASRG